MSTVQFRSAVRVFIPLQIGLASYFVYNLNKQAFEEVMAPIKKYEELSDDEIIDMIKKDVYKSGSIDQLLSEISTFRCSE